MPYAGLGLGSGGARDWRLGWQFSSARQQSLSLGVEATRREASNPGSGSGVEHGAMVSDAVRWLRRRDERVPRLSCSIEAHSPNTVPGGTIKCLKWEVFDHKK